MTLAEPLFTSLSMNSFNVYLSWTAAVLAIDSDEADSSTDCLLHSCNIHAIKAEDTVKIISRVLRGVIISRCMNVKVRQTWEMLCSLLKQKIISEGMADIIFFSSTQICERCPLRRIFFYYSAISVSCPAWADRAGSECPVEALQCRLQRQPGGPCPIFSVCCRALVSWPL